MIAQSCSPFSIACEDCVVHPGKTRFDEAEAFQYILIRQGRLYCRSDEAGRVITEGQLILAGPNEGKKLSIASDIAATIVKFSMDFLKELKERHFEEEILSKLPFFDILPGIEIYSLGKQDVEAVYQAMKRIEWELSEKLPADQVMIRLLFLELLVAVFRFKNPAEKEIPVIRDSIDNIIHYIQTNYSADFEFDAIVAKSGLNAAYFCRVFRERTGKSLFEFINTVRIEKACIQLKRTDRPIIDIAFDVGYQNLSFFNRYFRKITSLSPREYRQKAQM